MRPVTIAVAMRYPWLPHHATSNKGMIEPRRPEFVRFRLSGYVMHCQSNHYCAPIDEARIQKTLRSGSHAINAVVYVRIVFALAPTQ